MRRIKLDGELYSVYQWQRPEDADIATGEVVLAKYKDRPGLVFAYKNFSYNLYHALNYETDAQPEYVLEIPETPDIMLLATKIGDLRENKPVIKEYFSKNETD